MQVAHTVATALARHWGKAAQDAGGPHDHHTVLGHSLDVAACAFLLLDRHPILRTRFAQSGGLSTESTPATLAAVCCLHDIGKYDVRFARKAPGVADRLRPDSAGLVTGPYDHGTEGFRQVERNDRAFEQLERRLGGSAIPLLRAVTGHHGNLPTIDDVNPTRSALPPSLVREDAAARGAFVDLVCDFFESRGALLPWPAAVDSVVVQRVAGLTAIADWIGSDVEFFPYRPGPIGDLAAYWDESVARAVPACRAAGLLRAPTTASAFATLFPGYAPRDVQMLTEQVRGTEPALVIVEAEMGKGKTEAALALAARFLAHGQAEGLMVALPTMATSNAMFARVEDVAPRLYPGDEVQLALAHSRASRQPRFQALVQRGLRAFDPDATEASVACARWLLNRKRVLLAQIGIGTIDQALQAALTIKHQFVRLFGLSRDVVVIDEVHAYDAYMEVLLEHLLSWLGALRVPVVLLSATLPSERRAALAAAWRGGGGETGADGADEAKSRPYPLVTVATAVATSTLSGVSEAPARTIVLERIAKTEESAHLRETARHLIEAARRGARVAWVRNTVAEAQRAYDAVLSAAPDVEHVLFHARFRGVDRSRIEAHVLDRFGKSAPVGGRLLIATQVIEQSLDLDFDELHSDLAPIDLLFQRTGRLHRHVRPRLPGFEQPRLWVHVPSRDDSAALRYGRSQYVYDVATLWIAERIVLTRDALVLPDDIRILVEETYHPEARASQLQLGPARLLAVEAARIEKLEGKRAEARRCCIPSASADADGGAVMDDEDETVRAFTRDGTSTTVLPLLWDGAQARTLGAADDGPPWHLDANDRVAWQLVSELMDQTMSIVVPIAPTAPRGERESWEGFLRRFRRFAAETGLGKHLVPLPLRRHGDAFVGRAVRGTQPHEVRYSFDLGLQILRSEEA
ncbi:MAG: CRISPR-associated helicase Cas3' [Deltaproteobacteria bacterium]|nr:CRISPR-associated helicase Cas3' [Deltaproteobacteria bacterium]